MARYQYLVVPFIGKISGKQTTADAAQQLQDTINHHASQGWEFHAFNAISIEVKQGCLASLLGKKSEYISLDQLVFRQEK